MSEQLRGYSSYEEYLDSHLVGEDLYYLKVPGSRGEHPPPAPAGHRVCAAGADARLPLQCQGGRTTNLANTWDCTSGHQIGRSPQPL